MISRMCIGYKADVVPIHSNAKRTLPPPTEILYTHTLKQMGKFFMPEARSKVQRLNKIGLAQVDFLSFVFVYRLRSIVCSCSTLLLHLQQKFIVNKNQAPKIQHFPESHHLYFVCMFALKSFYYVSGTSRKIKTVYSLHQFYCCFCLLCLLLPRHCPNVYVVVCSETNTNNG